MTVYLRKDLKKPMWYFRLCIQGTRYNRPVPEATTQRDAEKAEAIFKSELLRGKYDLANRKGEMLFKDLVSEYNTYARLNKKSWKSEECRVNSLLNFFGAKKLREITPILIEKYRSDRRQTPRVHQKKQSKGKAPEAVAIITNASINREVSILRKMFSIAVENDWLDVHPCVKKKVKPLKEGSKRERFLTPSEENALFAQCTGDQEYLTPILVCALHTAMRKSEILKLEWNRVDLKTGYITVTQTKSGKDRNIPLSSTLKKHLTALFDTRQSNYVFANPDTQKPYTDLKKPWAKVLENAKVKGFRFHDLRHTAATRMVASGIDLIVVQDILGHADINTTMRYAHPVPERKLQAVSALDSYVADEQANERKVVSIK
jgi:integrase